MRIFLSAVCLVALSQAALAESGWTSYHNARFGTNADDPAGWKAGPPPENNDGLVFTSPDEKASLTISGSLNVDDNLDDAFKLYETPNQGETITYKRRIGLAITVSGTHGGNIFYAKHLLSCHNQIWNSIYLEYPAAQKADFDAIAAHVAKSLKGGRSGQVPNCRG